MQTRYEHICQRIGFLEGVIEGIRLYAIWSNGMQLVGCQRTPMSEALKPYEEELVTLQKHLDALRIYENTLGQTEH